MNILFKVFGLFCSTYHGHSQNIWQGLASKHVSYRSDWDIAKLKIRRAQGSLKIKLFSIVILDRTIDSKKN